MTFSGHLDNPSYQRLSFIASEGDVLAIDRALRMAGISPQVVGGLPLDHVPIQQFGMELLRLNKIERLPSGEVPIVTYLRNIAFQLKLRGQADKAEPFETAASSIGNKESGVPLLPDLSELPEVRNEVIVGLDDMVDFSFLGGGMTVGKSVARILVPRYEREIAVNLPSGDPWVMAGTAWLIGDDLALTNYHVVNARKQGEAPATSVDLASQVSGSIVQFDYDVASTPPFEVRVKSLVGSSNISDLDYALLRLEKKVGRASLRLYSDRMQLTGTRRPAVNIIQHPRGETKRVALRNNIVVHVDETSLHYLTDTDYGSSGSPVCDDYWRVVAIHRGALPAKNVQYMGKAQAYVNYGTQIAAVIDHIGASNSALRTEILNGQA